MGGVTYVPQGDEANLELFDNVRVMQLATGLSQANHSLKQDLGKVSANADLQEAEQRAQQARINTVRAQTVFNSKVSRFNLGYIGRGYDIFQGHPISPDGVVDPGFRLPVIDLPYSWRHTADGEYRVPDNVDVVSEPSAKFVSSASITSSADSYSSKLRSEFSAGMSASGSVFGASFQASFSANSAYQRDTKELKESKKSYVDITGRAVAYRARLSLRQSKVSPAFENALRGITGYTCDSDDVTGLQPYLEILHEFGTHVTKEVVMGARAVQRKVVSKEATTKVEREMRDNGVSASAGGGYGAFSASISASVKNKESSESSEKSGLKTSETREFYVGGSAPGGSLEDGSTESLREWARSAREAPAPIQYSLEPIEELLRTDAYFRKPVKYLTTKLRCMQLAVQRFCLHVTSGSELCTAKETTDTPQKRKRRKRSIGSSPHKHIKYGDFIQLYQHGFLGLEKDVSFVGGESSCYKLAFHSGPARNRNYFQILPTVDEPHLIGEVVHPGAKFRLNSYQGADVILIPNIPDSEDLPTLVSQDSDKLNSFTQNGWALCVPARPLSGHTFYILTSRTMYRYRPGDLITLIGLDNRFTTVGLPCPEEACDLRLRPAVLPETTRNVGKIKRIILSRGFAYGGYIQITNVLEKRWQSLTCDSNRPSSCRAVDDALSDGLDILTENYLSYPVEFSFRDFDLEDDVTPIREHDRGVLQVHSRRPPQKVFWGYDAPEILIRKHGKSIAVDTVESQTDISSCKNIYGTCADRLYTHGVSVMERLVRVVIDYPFIEPPPFEITFKNALGITGNLKPVRFGKQFMVLLKSWNIVRKISVEFTKPIKDPSCRVKLTLCEDKLSRGYKDEDIAWDIISADIDLITSPVIHLVEKVDPQPMEEEEVQEVFKEMRIPYPHENPICNGDHIIIRQKLSSIMDNPVATFEEPTLRVERSDGRTFVILTVKIFAPLQIALESFVEDLEDRLRKHPESLPCAVPFARSRLEDPRDQGESIAEPLRIFLIVTLVILLLCIICMGVIIYFCHFKIEETEGDHKERSFYHDPAVMDAMLKELNRGLEHSEDEW